MLDVAMASCAVVILSPLLLIVSIAILVTMGRPILFCQLRPGRDGAPFLLRKFRTMRNDPDVIDDPARDAMRLTRLGNFLRRTSIDELPELFNIIGGSMSFVGPRPLLMSYLERYDAAQRRRHDVLPGLTGWAQVNGRNATTWEERFRHDLWYVDNWSPMLDLRILWSTVSVVLRRDGVNQAGDITMPAFLGSASVTPAESSYRVRT
jgi:lipopolysaccharide/colanic/teichoic acid biosynthesis glycosyltransferase